MDGINDKTFLIKLLGGNSGAGGVTPNAITYAEQNLTDEQKEQARNNIGAIGYTRLETTLTDEEKKTARENIGAAADGQALNTSELSIRNNESDGDPVVLRKGDVDTVVFEGVTGEGVTLKGIADGVEPGDAVNQKQLGKVVSGVEHLKTYLTPQMYGAVGDGETDDSDAIQAMFDDAAGVKNVYFPTGNYLTKKTINVPVVPDIEMDGMIVANHAGPALVLGDPKAYTVNKCVKVKLTKGGTKYESGSIGLVIGAFARSTFYLAFVNGFEINVKLSCNGGSGIFFNTFYIDDLNYAGWIGLDLDGTTNWIDGTHDTEDGWVNDNLFIGGSIGKGGSITEDAAAIRITHGGSNTFLKNGMEGVGTSVHIVYGNRNSFLYSRCEGSTIALRVDGGRDNTMSSNYDNPVFVDNSQNCTSGITKVGIHEICKYSAVGIDRIDSAKVFTIGNKITTEYFRFFNTSNGEISDQTYATLFELTNGTIVRKGNSRPCFEFDTTKNKRFELPGVPSVIVCLFNENGKVAPTAETLKDYIRFDAGGTPVANEQTGGVHSTACRGFEVSGDIIKVALVFNEDTYGNGGIMAGFDIRTEYPCKPIRDEILTVAALPTNGYIGAKVIYKGALYTYNGTEWKAV